MAVTINGSNGVTTNSGAFYDGINRGTAVNTTSGTSIDFTGIPSWAERITVIFNGVSTSGTSTVLLQLGTSGGITTSGYVGVGSAAQNAGTLAVVSFTAGAGIGSDSGATYTRHGQAVLTNITGNTWSIVFTGGDQTTTRAFFSASSISLGAALDRVRITTAGGTDTFDAGSINIMYE